MNKVLFKSFLIIIVSLTGWSGSAQQALLKIAHKQFNNRQYVSAQKTYLNVLETDYRDALILKNLGDAYYFNSQFKKASKWYKEYITSYPNDVEAEYFYRYAQSLKSNDDYEESNKYMDKFLLLKKEDIRANVFNNKRDYLKRITYQSGRYEIKNESINSEFTDFGTAFYGNHLVFSSSRDTLLMSHRKHKQTGESFLELYTTVYDSITGKLSKPRPFSKELSTKFHESSPTFTSDGNTIYFTRNNITKNELNRLKIYRSHKNSQGDWGPPESLPFNSDTYSTAHPALSADGKTLYFSSDMPGSFGMSDIYRVSINHDGSMGDPINLGKEINTEGKETFPFISNENELYFSSDGHPGLGGLDIFVSDVTTNPKEIINIGQPVNGQKDDFAFIINDSTRMGYFSSNRDGGKGGDDIYSFTEFSHIKSYYPEKVTGFIKDKNTQKALSGAKVVVYNEENSPIADTITDLEGKYYFSEINLDRTFTIRVSKKGYQSYEVVANLTEFSQEYESEIALEKTNSYVLLVTPKHFNDSNTEILPSSKKELDQIIKQLKAQSTIDVIVTSYPDTENEDISIATNRAKMVMQYFVDNGLDEKRFSIKVVPKDRYPAEQVFKLIKDTNVDTNTSSDQLLSGVQDDFEKVNTFILLVDPKHFNDANTEILPSSKEELDEIIAELKAQNPADVIVISYPDTENEDPVITANRAKMVMQYFVDNGMDEKRFSTKVVPKDRYPAEQVFKLIKDTSIDDNTSSDQLLSGVQDDFEKVNTFILLVDSKHFNDANTEILPSSKEELDEIIAELKAQNPADVIVISYPDTEGEDPVITANRAKMVMQYFVDNGMDEKRFSTKVVPKDRYPAEQVFKLIKDTSIDDNTSSDQLLSGSQNDFGKVNSFILLADPKHFNDSNTEILSNSKKELDEIVPQLKAQSTMAIQVVSYLDTTNEDMSTATNQADLVMQYFVDKGIDKKRFSTKGVEKNKYQIEKVFKLMMNIPPIHFSTNSGRLHYEDEKELEKIIEIMNLYSEIRIEVQGHADSRGTKATNIKVSNKRAQTIVNYLISKGISKNRLVAKGYGETRLINSCADGVPCSEEEHKYNRRCQFVVIK